MKDPIPHYDLIRRGRTHEAPTPEAFLREHLKVLEVKPGDMLVLTAPQMLAPSERRHLKAEWDACAAGTGAEGVKVFVLSGGLDVDVIRSADTQS